MAIPREVVGSALDRVQPNRWAELLHPRRTVDRYLTVTFHGKKDGTS